MGSFNKEKYESEFNPRKYELEKDQSAEMRSIIEKYKASGKLGTAEFYDRRMEIKKRQYSDFIELAINSFTASITAGVKIDDSDKLSFEEALRVMCTSYLEKEKSGLKAAMVSYGNTIDSTLVTETVKAYDKQLTEVKLSTMKILPDKIQKHNNAAFNKKGSSESTWSKYKAIFIITAILAVICAVVLYFIL